MPWLPVINLSQLWSGQTKATQSWNGAATTSLSWITSAKSVQTWSGSGAPSAESRLNRIFPQSAVTQEDLSFIWRIQSDGPFFIATGNNVYIRSGITEQIN